MREYDYSRLLGRIKERGETQETVAKAISINVSTLNQKLNNKRDFSQSEIKNICNFLDISDIKSYFFVN